MSDRIMEQEKKEPMNLTKRLSTSGAASRRKAAELIKEGAGLIESFDDVRLAFSSGMHAVELNALANDDALQELSPECRQVYEMLCRRDNDLEGLQESSGMEPGLLMSALSQLEFRCLIERDADFYYRVLKS